MLMLFGGRIFRLGCENSALMAGLIHSCIHGLLRLCSKRELSWAHLPSLTLWCPLLCYPAATGPSLDAEQMPAPCIWISQPPESQTKRTSMLYILPGNRNFVTASESRWRYSLREMGVGTLKVSGRNPEHHVTITSRSRSMSFCRLHHCSAPVLS